MGKNNIVLCGFMGCGKTTVGKQLAKITNMEYIDLDQYIEQQQSTTISNIFAQHGEEYFRDLEHNAAKELSQKQGCIIAAGGGTLLYKRNVQALKQNGTVVLLNVPLNTIKHRLRYDKKTTFTAKTGQGQGYGGNVQQPFAAVQASKRCCNKRQQIPPCHSRGNKGTAFKISTTAIKICVSTQYITLPLNIVFF